MENELGFVIVTHGDMGAEMLAVASHIMGKKLGRFVSVKVPFSGGWIDPGSQLSVTPFKDRRQWLEQKVISAVEEVDNGNGVILFTDIIGGTAFNVSQHLLDTKKVAVIAGVNLPMLLKVPSIRYMPLAEAAIDLVERSRKAIEYRRS
jgi:PTS system mannose-specific IIA component